MARTISEEELQLKKRARRRLVGAIVLVTAVAVVLPMVLDSEPKPVNQNVDIHIPPADSGEFKPKAATPTQTPTQAATPIKGLPEGRSEPPPPANTDAPPVARAAEPVTDGTKGRVKAEAPEAKPAVKPETREAKATAADDPAETAKPVAETPRPARESGAYVVQVAALADPAKARQLQKQMSGAGLKTYTEVVSTKSGEVTRVRAGPFATREAAEKARVQLKKAGLEGQVVPTK